MAVLVGYLVPVTVVPALSENTWVAAVPQIAKSNATFLFGAAAALDRRRHRPRGRRRPVPAATPLVDARRHQPLARHAQLALKSPAAALVATP